MLLGLQSIDVTAAVAQDRIILWHVNESWNGAKAAEMYAKLGAALRATWGNKRAFRVVEDGDTKGFQSNKGKCATEEQRIESWMLSPRTPGLMPLDFSLWNEIERRALACNIGRAETSEQFAARLRRTALALPSDIVVRRLAKMKDNIRAIVASKGKHTHLD